MASHQDLSARNQARDDRTVHLGGLQFQTSREEIAAVVASHGFHECVFYWPHKPARYQHHTGWCFVEFADDTTANSAREQLNGAQFGGRPAKAGKPSKAPGRAPSGQPTPSSSGQPNLSPSVGQSDLSAITAGIANVALADIQDPEATDAAAEVENEARPSVKSEITFFVHPFSISPTAQAKIDLKATHIGSYSQAWGPKEDAPPSDATSRSAIHDRCIELDRVYMAAGVRSGFPFARIIETEDRNDPDQNPRVVDKSGLLARQYPNPAPENDELANSMPVLMIKDGPKLPDVKLGYVNTPVGDGWRHYVQHVPDEADVDKKCDRVVDVHNTDQPWKDTERWFERGINATNYPGGSQWFPGAVLDRPVVDGIPQGTLSFCDVECISNTPEYRNQGHTGDDLRTATNLGHSHIKKRPQSIGMGWGGYDAFHQWQANGRKINPDDVEQRDWQFDARKMVVVEEGTGKETTFEVEEGSALDRLIKDEEDTGKPELKSLSDVLHPKKQFKKRYTGGRLGGEY